MNVLISFLIIAVFVFFSSACISGLLGSPTVLKIDPESGDRIINTKWVIIVSVVFALCAWGFAAGQYDEGYSAGRRDGYEEGYDQGCEEYEWQQQEN